MADLLTLADARAAITTATASGDLANDALVTSYINAVTPVIEEMSQPVTTLTRTRTADGGMAAVMLPWRFSAVTSITESGSLLTSDDYVAAGDDGLIYRAPDGARWASGRRNVTVVVTTGVTTVPGNQKLAAQLLFAHLWRLRQGPRPAFNQPGGDVVFTPTGFAVPNAVAELLVATPPLPGFA